MKNKYHISEGLRTALILAFVSGFMEAYSFTTQGGRFSGVQTGNIIYLMMSLAHKDYKLAGGYLLPICVFILGSILTYYSREFAKIKNYSWYIIAATCLLAGVILIGISANLHLHSLTVSLSAFVASIQAESFKQVRGTPYASVMMTGNVKNMSVLIAQGLREKNKKTLEKGLHTFYVVLTFALGVYLATELSDAFGVSTIFILVIPLSSLIYFLYKNKG